MAFNFESQLFSRREAYKSKNLYLPGAKILGGRIKAEHLDSLDFVSARLVCSYLLVALAMWPSPSGRRHVAAPGWMAAQLANGKRQRLGGGIAKIRREFLSFLRGQASWDAPKYSPKTDRQPTDFR